MGITRPTISWLSLLLLLFFSGFARAVEVIPPVPANHFNDFAGIVSPQTAQALNAELTQFERDTSNQILVAIYPHLQTDSSIEDYTVRVKQAWGVGQKGRDNGAVLFIFSQDRKLYIQVGYGLEGVLPDALCKQIIENEITPRFRTGDYEGGVSAGTRALMAAARGEYTGTGRTVRESKNSSSTNIGGGGAMLLFFVVIVISVISRLFRRNTIYSRRGRISPWIGGGYWGGGSGGWGGGSGGGGGGGSFSGGGGGGGGGGAGGSW